MTCIVDGSLREEENILGGARPLSPGLHAQAADFSSALHRCHPWGHFRDGVTEALKELTQSYPDRAEVQDFSISSLTCHSGPSSRASPRSGLRPPDFTLAGRRWTCRAKPFCSGGGSARPESQAASLASTASPQHTLSPFFRAPLQDSQDARLRGTSPQPRGRRGRLTQQKPPSPPGPGAPGAGAQARGGVLRASCFVRPRPSRAPSAGSDFIH